MGLRIKLGNRFTSINTTYELTIIMKNCSTLQTYVSQTNFLFQPGYKGSSIQVKVLMCTERDSTASVYYTSPGTLKTQNPREDLSAVEATSYRSFVVEKLLYGVASTKLYYHKTVIILFHCSF